MPRSSATSSQKTRAAARSTLAAQADRHALYERAVQDPDGDVKFFARTYRKLRGHDPVSMREDFCGTAALCEAWARSAPERTAMGVDLSQETMNWGIEHHLAPAGREIAGRVNHHQPEHASLPNHLVTYELPGGAGHPARQECVG